MKYLIKSKNFYVDILVIIIGSFIASLGVNLFLSNAKLLSGGVTGIALILQYLWEVPSGITVFLLNIPLFFVSYKYLNKRFTIYTAIGMLSFSTALMITKPLSTLVQEIIEEIRVVFEKTPPELAADIADRGIILTGGGSLLRGLEELIESKTGIHTVTAKDPMTAVAVGTGKFVEFMAGERDTKDE